MSVVVSDIRHPPSAIRAAERRLVLVPERDASAGQVIGRYFDFHAIADQYPDPEATHVAGERREYGMSIVQGYPECRAREDF